MNVVVVYGIVDRHNVISSTITDAWSSFGLLIDFSIEFATSSCKTSENLVLHQNSLLR